MHHSPTDLDARDVHGADAGAHHVRSPDDDPSFTVGPDLVGRLASPSREVAAARLTKPEVAEQAQLAHERLFTGAGQLSPELRRGLAARVAEHHGADELAAHHRSHGAADLNGGITNTDPTLGALIRHADLASLSPALVTAANHLTLSEIGIDADTVLTVSQIVAFTSFQSRLIEGLGLLSGTASTETRRTAPVAELAVGRTKHHPIHAANGRPTPTHYTTDVLGWLPWVPPVPEDELTAEQEQAFAGKSGGEYFRLLARHPGVLAARTRIDHAVFLTRHGLPRAERELAAAVTSKVNDCMFCASVHARKAAQMSKRADDVDRLLTADVPRAPGWLPSDLRPLTAGQDERWAAIIDFAAALARTPSAATPGQVDRLGSLGLTTEELVDLVSSVAFFSWANRLMLTLGEPFLPEHPTNRAAGSARTTASTASTASTQGNS